MARRVADVRLALDVLSGAHPRDPWSIDAPLDPLRKDPALRIAIVAEPPGGPTDPTSRQGRPRRRRGAARRRLRSRRDRVRRATRRSARSSGSSSSATSGRHAATCSSRSWGRTGVLFQHRQRRRAAARRRRHVADPHRPLQPGARLVDSSWRNIRSCCRRSGRNCLSRSVSTSPRPKMSRRRGRMAGRCFRPICLGLPSACVPAGRDAATGLPIGVLLTGRLMRDGECLDAAEAIESRLGLKTPIDPV